jgi:hypothetical protein
MRYQICLVYNNNSAERWYSTTQDIKSFVLSITIHFNVANRQRLFQNLLTYRI